MGPANRQANAESYSPEISANGRVIAFVSEASNLVAADTNDVSDVFLRDREAGGTRRVSVGQDGQQASLGSNRPAISADGRHVAFGTRASSLVPGDTNGVRDVFVRDRFGDRAG